MASGQRATSSRRRFSVGMTAAALVAGGAGRAAAQATPAPIDYDGATLASGTISGLVLYEGAVTVDVDGTSHGRNGRAVYTMTSNDPRVAGNVEETWNSDRWGPGGDDGALVQWGTAVLTNEDGTWEAPYAGVYSTTTGDLLVRWYVGSGAYAGLTFFMWLNGLEAWTGLIYPGSPPPER